MLFKNSKGFCSANVLAAKVSGVCDIAKPCRIKMVSGSSKCLPKPTSCQMIAWGMRATASQGPKVEEKCVTSLTHCVKCRPEKWPQLSTQGRRRRTSTTRPDAIKSGQKMLGRLQKTTPRSNVDSARSEACGPQNLPFSNQQRFHRDVAAWKFSDEWRNPKSSADFSAFWPFQEVSEPYTQFATHTHKIHQMVSIRIRISHSPSLTV